MVEDKGPDPNFTQSPDDKAEDANPAETDRRTGEVDSEIKEEEQTQDLEQPRKDQGRYIVGIGASAGGLEAMEELIKTIADINAAIVVVQHLSPHHTSALTQLLSRNSKIEIVTATDGTVLEANRIYVIPPNADLSVFHGVLHISTPGSSPHFAIDYFLRSLAEDQGPHAIGVILSGTGTDGTFGLIAIKAAGGITFVQEPSSARYDGMPRSALASGTSDFCLTPTHIAEELVRITNDRRLRRPPPSLEFGQSGRAEFEKVLMLIRSEFGN